ncbi:hypothetical protein ACFO0B_02345 [Nocardia jiangsuensis]|uniref:Uncharacterized protein n=1 Tax=Nocardia jiangsuensis TaxID=1691563 RepID=A0ABV8DLZ2_9NOCA
MTAADHQLAADVPVMPIGGFSAGDPGRLPGIRRRRRHPPGSSASDRAGTGIRRHRIAEWVRDTFTPIQLGDVTLYGLTAPR